MNVTRATPYRVLVAYVLGFLLPWLGCRGEPEWARELSTPPLPQPLSVRVAPGQFFFAENNSNLCAIRFTNEHGWDQATYESYLIPQRQGELSFSHAEQDTGEVFELLEAKDEWGDKRLVEDAGSQVHVTCGGASIIWSSGNWIYSGDDWRFAITKCPTLECAAEQYDTVSWLEEDSEGRPN